MSGEERPNQLEMVTQETGKATPANDQTSRTTDQWRSVGELESTALLIVEASRAKAPGEAQTAYLIEEFVALAREADREAEQLADVVLDATGD